MARMFAETKSHGVKEVLACLQEAVPLSLAAQAAVLLLLNRDCRLQAWLPVVILSSTGSIKASFDGRRISKPAGIKHRDGCTVREAQKTEPSWAVDQGDPRDLLP